MADFVLLESSNLISSKIWVIVKSWNFHTVFSQKRAFMMPNVLITLNIMKMWWKEIEMSSTIWKLLKILWWFHLMIWHDILLTDITDSSFRSVIERLVIRNGGEKLKLEFYYNSLDTNWKWNLHLLWIGIAQKPHHSQICSKIEALIFHQHSS